MVTITVNDVNDAPAVLDDSYAVDEDALLVVATPGVLGNDTDADGDALGALLVDGPDHGTLTLNADGSFMYAPDLNFFTLVIRVPCEFDPRAACGTWHSNIKLGEQPSDLFLPPAEAQIVPLPTPGGIVKKPKP